MCVCKAHFLLQNKAPIFSGQYARYNKTQEGASSNIAYSFFIIRCFIIPVKMMHYLLSSVFPEVLSALLPILLYILMTSKLPYILMTRPQVLQIDDRPKNINFSNSCTFKLLFLTYRQKFINNLFSLPLYQVFFLPPTFLLNPHSSEGPGI